MTNVMNNTEMPWVTMGYIKAAVGLKGWVKVGVDTESVDSLLKYPTWRLKKETHVQTLTLDNGKVSGHELQVKFQEVNDRNAADLLRGYIVEINRADFVPTDGHEFYWCDLVNLSVFNRDNICLGQVTTLMETGAHDVLVVDGDYGRKLIPFVGKFIDHVQLNKHRIDVDWGVDY